MNSDYLSVDLTLADPLQTSGARNRSLNRTVKLLNGSSSGVDRTASMLRRSFVSLTSYALSSS